MPAGFTVTSVEWESEEFSNTKIKPLITANHSPSPKPR